MLTQARLKQKLEYDPDTGKFSVKGNIDPKGYVRIGVDYCVYRANRLAFLYMTGCWPDGVVDHINGDKADNRWCNLRDVPSRVNSENMRKARVDNGTAMLGVEKHGSKFRARIRVKGVRISSQQFDTPEQAYAEYLSMKRKLHEGCTL